MTDLEMTKLCAEAMKLAVQFEGGLCVAYQQHGFRDPTWHRLSTYDPLHNDAQAMALVKQFSMEITRHENGKWYAWLFHRDGQAGMRRPSTGNNYLNRAIVETVAKMQISLRAAASQSNVETPVKHEEAPSE